MLSRPYLKELALAWAIYHHYASRIPTFVILLGSGALMNFLVSIVCASFYFCLSVREWSLTT